MSNPDPSIIVIFGASGDLTRRKLLPAVYNLAESHLLPEAFAILGIARPPIDDMVFRSDMRKAVEQAEGEPLDPGLWRHIEERLHYAHGDFQNPGFYEQLNAQLADLDKRHQTAGNYLFYLAVPPELFGTIPKYLAGADLTREQDHAWRRVVIEKPFGYDLESACKLNANLHAAGLKESQIYRIDHYLGKETVQNILAFRFANGIFEPIWNRRYVDHVQMTVAETVGVEQRGAYYDRAGALRDMVQNHMFLLLTLVAMEPPISFRADDVRDEKVKVLHAIPKFTDADVGRAVVRGQYGRGPTPDMRAYREEPKVDPHSTTETFAALELQIENWRWAGVPFYLRTGKRLERRATEIAVQFKLPPLLLFRKAGVRDARPNVLALRIQPDEGISLEFQAKEPGPFDHLGTVKMDFSYLDYFGAEPSTGYETLLYDAMIGDQTLFHRMDMVEAGWQVVQPILDAWRRSPPPDFPNYESGTWGPAEADLLIERGDRQWRS
jgi:glucose-6-phosphate 1-dehydrogenase